MECFFCKLPLTSDDFKKDKVEEARSFIAHRDCIDSAQEHGDIDEDFDDRFDNSTKYARLMLPNAGPRN